jgi:hypothetical protein
VLENIGANIYIFEVPFTVGLHVVFHVNNLRPCPTATLRPYVPVTAPKDEDDEYDFDLI